MLKIRFLNNLYTGGLAIQVKVSDMTIHELFRINIRVNARTNFKHLEIVGVFLHNYTIIIRDEVEKHIHHDNPLLFIP
jgi:hypothetical protein